MDLAFFGAQKDKKILSLRQFSAILTSGTAAYATGKLLGGPIVDYAGGRSILTTLTALMGVCFISIGRTTSPIIMSILWSFSRLVHSLGWPAMSVLMRNWFSDLPNGAFVNSVISTSSRAGVWAPISVIFGNLRVMENTGYWHWVIFHISQCDFIQFSERKPNRSRRRCVGRKVFIKRLL